MPILTLSMDTKSDTFKANKAASKKIIHDFNKQRQRIEAGGNEKAQQRLKALNKLPVRERIQRLIDPDTPFQELGAFAGYELYDTPLPAGGIITGIGQIHGTPCMIMANDPTVKAGTYFPITCKKQLRAQEIADENHLPCIYLVDSGGGFLPLQDEIFPDKDHFGRIFYNQARLSAKNIPQIAMVLGSATAGGAYVPAMADITIMVKQQSHIFLGGPPLVQAATGEIVSAEQLGGADVHCRKSGVADYYAADEQEAIDQARSAIAHLNRQPTLYAQTQPVIEPRYPAKNIPGFIPTDSRVPMEVRDIIACTVDDSEFDEFKQYYGNTLICGFAHIHGIPVGIIANNGILFSESALKGTQFIQLCCQRKIPLVFLQNITGFMVGQSYEARGIAKDGAKMVNAVACATVPKITIIIGGSFGAGNYAMCGRAYNPRFLAIWPNAKISIMGGEQAANVLTQIKVDQLQRQGGTWPEEEKKTFWNQIHQQYDRQSHAYYASARLWNDVIINPDETRQWLQFALNTSLQTPIEPTHFGVFRM